MSFIQNFMPVLFFILPQLCNANRFLALDGSSYPAPWTAPVPKQEWIDRYLSNINYIQPASIVSSCSETYAWNLSFDDGPGSVTKTKFSILLTDILFNAESLRPSFWTI